MRNCRVCHRWLRWFWDGSRWNEEHVDGTPWNVHLFDGQGAGE